MKKYLLSIKQHLPTIGKMLLGYLRIVAAFFAVELFAFILLKPDNLLGLWFVVCYFAFQG